jgi:hypothetical protein
MIGCSGQLNETFPQNTKAVGHWWFMSVTLAVQEEAIRRMAVKASLGKQFMRPYLKKKKKKTHHKEGRVEWLKV